MHEFWRAWELAFDGQKVAKVVVYGEPTWPSWSVRIFY